MSKKAITPEGRENQLINAAVDLAEKQIKDGTASSAVIVHYLKLATAREKASHAKILADIELSNSKIDMMDAQKKATATAQDAINAILKYSGKNE